MPAAGVAAGGDGGGGGEAAGARGAAAAHCKSAAFFRAALGGAPSPTATGSGWDPMLDDFENTSVLVGRSE